MMRPVIIPYCGLIYYRSWSHDHPMFKMAAPMEAESFEEENQEIRDDDLSNRIFSQYELFHRIFRNLPAKTLNTCCMVCKEWRREIQKIKSSRRKMAWMLYDSDQQKTHDDLSPVIQLTKRIENLSFEPRQALVFISSELAGRRLVLPAIELPTRPSPGSNPGPPDLPGGASPSTGTNPELADSPSGADPGTNPRPPDSPSGSTRRNLPRAAKRPCPDKHRPQVRRTSLDSFLRSLLPRSCRIDGVCANGVVGTDELIGAPREIDKHHGKAAAMLFLAEMPGVAIYNFNYESTRIREDKKKPKDRATLQSMTGIPQEANVRCVLLWRPYCDDDLQDFDETPLCDVIGYTCRQAVVAGGYPDDPVPRDRDDTAVKGVAFCGDDLQVASVVLERNGGSTKSEINKKLRQLKETGIRVDKHTIGFMFACVGRGHHMHGKSNVEADIFKSHFPRVPLLGMFGNGEIGFDHLPDYTDAHAQEDMHVQEVTHDELELQGRSFTTVFVVLSLPGGGGG